MPPSTASKPITMPRSDVEAVNSHQLLDRAAGRVVLALLRAYKVLLSPLFTGSCRFHPSCADYAAEAVMRYGAARGSWMGVRRLCRCHPLGGHGVDPVPGS